MRKMQENTVNVNEKIKFYKKTREKSFFFLVFQSFVKDLLEFCGTEKKKSTTTKTHAFWVVKSSVRTMR